MTATSRAALLLTLLGAPPAFGASFCDPELALRLDAVQMGVSSVEAVELRNIGSLQGDFAGVELVVTVQGKGALHERVAKGEPTIHRLQFPSDVRLRPGEVLTIGLRGGFAYKRAFGQWPDLERPIRGGEPEVPDLRVAAEWVRLGAAPELVGVVCPGQRDLDVMGVTVGTGRTQAPPYEAPPPVEAPEPAPTDPSQPDPCPAAPPPPPPPPPLPTAPRWAIDTRGFGGGFVRAFTPDDDEATNDVSAGPEVQATLELEKGRTEVVTQLYALADVQDGAERGVITAQDAFVGVKKGRYRLRVGVQSLTWTSLEVFRPADTVNARFLDGDLSDPARLGEPMVEGRVLVGSWSLQAFVMPMYVASVLPAGSSRRSPLPGVEVGRPIWIASGGERVEQPFGLQGAVRLSGTVGPLDLAVHGLHHVDRVAPLLVFDAAEGQLRPVYLPVDELGWTGRVVAGRLLLKLEGAYRDFGEPVERRAWGPLPDRDHLALAGGIDLTLDAGRTTHTLLVEAQTLQGADRDRLAQLTPFQRDAVGAWRLDLNDKAGRSTLLGAVLDLEQTDRIYGLAGYKQRVFEFFTAELSALYIRAPEGDELQPLQLERLDGDLQLELRLARYF
jgi:hypothetical protein